MHRFLGVVITLHTINRLIHPSSHQTYCHRELSPYIEDQRNHHSVLKNQCILPRSLYPKVTLITTKMQLLYWQSTPDTMLPNLTYLWKLPLVPLPSFSGYSHFSTSVWHEHSIASFWLLWDSPPIRVTTAFYPVIPWQLFIQGYDLAFRLVLRLLVRCSCCLNLADVLGGGVWSLW